MIKKITENVENKSIRRLSAICNKFGYVLDENSCIEVIRGTKYLDVYVYPNGENKYSPDIYAPTRASGRKLPGDIEFRIATVSYGSLNCEEYEKFVMACENAYKLVNILNDFDYSEFPEVVEET